MEQTKRTPEEEEKLWQWVDEIYSKIPEEERNRKRTPEQEEQFWQWVDKINNIKKQQENDKWFKDLLQELRDKSNKQE